MSSGGMQLAAGTVLLLASLAVQSAARLYGPVPGSDTLTDHDRLSYQPLAGQRTKRSVGDRVDEDIRLEFDAHGRRFRLRLRHNPHVAAAGARLVVGGNSEPLAFPEAVHGRLEGEPDSRVYGSLVDGVFRGAIHTAAGVGWYVEPSAWYFVDRQPFHTIVYNDTHVRWPAVARLGGLRHPPTCGWSDPRTAGRLHQLPGASPTRERARDHHEGLYSPVLNRRRRATAEPKVCSLYMQSDTLLWEATLKLSSVNGDEERAKTELRTMFQHHVSAASHIYSRTRFSSGGYQQNGIQFNVNRIRINTSADCTPDNKFCNPNIDVTNFLNLHAYSNHSEHCLAYVFTYRDFSGGTLGLAWVGTKDQNGGICEKYREYDEQTPQTPGRRAWKSLNTGIVTLVNFGRRIVEKVSYLTFAHEMGHNFGANHDDSLSPPQAECQPPSDQGNYIMFSSATTGDLPNNNKFSPCSQRSIGSLLEAVVNERNGKTNCLKPSSDISFCGNNLLEPGEQCDCGYEDECQDKCCIPKSSRSNANACMVVEGKTCSPSGNPCCTQGCGYANSTTLCRGEADCTLPTLCSGSNQTCPVAENKPDNTTCRSDTKLCRAGNCDVSICTMIGWEECLLSADDGKGVDSSSMCFLGCRPHNRTGCVSTRDVASKRNTSSPVFRILERVGRELDGLQLQVGSPCDKFRGYCNSYLECRRVDSKGPLGRLQDLLFSPETIELVRTWIITHWYYVILICLGIVVGMGVFVKLCAVHTPSTNPNRPAARKLTLRRPSRPHGHHHQHQRQHRQGAQAVGMVPLGSVAYTEAAAAAVQSAPVVPNANASANASANANANASANAPSTSAAALQPTEAAASQQQPAEEPPPPYTRDEQRTQPPAAHGKGKRRGHRQAMESQAAKYRQP